MEDGSPRRTRGSKAATVRKPLILQGEQPIFKYKLRCLLRKIRFNF